MRPGMSSAQEEGLALVEHCFDEEDSSVHLTVTFKDVAEEGDELPWIALGYREDEQCVMNPRSGGDSDIILLTTENGNGVPSASFGPLPRTVKNFDPSIISSVYDGLAPLAEKEGFSDIDVSVIDHATPTAISSRSAASGHDSVRLSFKQKMDAAPDAMHLMYAVGTSPKFGYHSTCRCFELKDFPACKAASEEDVVDTAEVVQTSIFNKYGSSSGNAVAGMEAETTTSSSSTRSVSGLLAIVFVMCAMLRTI